MRVFLPAGTHLPWRVMGMGKFYTLWRVWIRVMDKIKSDGYGYGVVPPAPIPCGCHPAESNKIRSPRCGSVEWTVVYARPLRLPTKKPLWRGSVNTRRSRPSSPDPVHLHDPSAPQAHSSCRLAAAAAGPAPHRLASIRNFIYSR
jgi:hypothetical protein